MYICTNNQYYYKENKFINMLLNGINKIGNVKNKIYILHFKTFVRACNFHPLEYILNYEGSRTFPPEELFSIRSVASCKKFT